MNSEESARILCIDDDEAKRYAISRFLRREGFAVIEGGTGSEALELARNRPDLIILDVNLPDINGFEVCARIRQDPATSTIPILHLSASFVEVRDKVKGLESGADAYLVERTEPEELIATVRALLRMKRAEAAARELAAKWGATFEAIGDAIVIVDADWRVQHSNPSFQRLAARGGLREGDIPEFCRAPVRQALETGKATLSEVETLGLFLRLGVNPIPGEHQDIAGVVCIVSDMTAHRRAEEAVHRSERRYRHLTEFLPHMVWTCDEAGRSESYNRRFRDYAGAAADARPNWLEFVHPEEREATFLAWRQSTLSGENFETECRLARADQVYRWHLLIANAWFDEERNAGKWLVTATDVHEQKRYQHGLERAVDDLRQFSYAASHDLREPLRMVSAYADLLSQRYRGKLDSTADQFLGTIVDGVLRLHRQIDGLRDYWQAAAFDTARLGPVDANTALAIAIRNLEGIIRANAADIQSSDLPTVPAQEFALVQIFQNLISNAIKYAQGRPRISVAARSQNGEWIFSVHDNGIGIAPEQQKNVFRLFQRLHGSEYEGAGIGLALCQKITERLGGRIWVESEPGRGSTFYFTVPA
ncbi:MAG: response regulator [Bryobacteraceae bacterium]|nr:response regulator [Bryobacteraceae bacterium]